MLRPMPNLNDPIAMARLGRMSAIRSARLDACHDLRDACTRLMNVDGDTLSALANARECLDRIEALEKLREEA